MTAQTPAPIVRLRLAAPANRFRASTSTSTAPAEVEPGGVEAQVGDVASTGPAEHDVRRAFT